MKSAASKMSMEQQLREMNEALLVSSIRQHELTEQTENSERLTRDARDFALAILRTSPVTLLVLESDLRVVFANEAFYQSFQVLPEETEGRLVYELGNGQWNIPRLRELLENILPNQSRFEHFEVTHEFETIGRRTMLLNARRLDDHEVKLPELHGRIVLVIEDITERKRAEEASAFLASIVQTSGDAIISKGLDGVITSWNRGAEQLFGYRAEEAIGQPITMLIPSDRLSEEPKIIECLKRGEPVNQFETKRVRKDGSLLDISLTISPVKDANGRVIGASKIARDITERKQAEAALHESEQRYRTLFEAMDEGYCIIEVLFDPQGQPDDYRFIEVNGSFERQSGMHDVVGKRMLEFVPTIESHWLNNYSTVALTGESVRFSGEYKGLHRWFDVFAFRAEGWPERHVAVLFADVTQRTQAEQALTLAREHAEAANRAKDLFLATLSHEMRTPLSAIVGWMQVLQGGRSGGCSDADLNEGLEVVERNARTLVQLLDDVLDVSRIISGKVRLEVRPCELSAVVGAGLDVVRSAARAKNIALTAKLDPAASAASCDASRIQQVVWNLLSNAIKFTPKGGRVHLALDRRQSDLRIQVSDSGQGIDPELLPYVFDRFRQADSSTRRRLGGLGLGLSIVKHLVELHGGTVQAQSEGEGCGSTFTVLLPVHAVRTDESGDDPQADESELRSTPGMPLVRLDALRVLVVDDEPDARRLVVKVLREAGAVVTVASSAAEAIEALEKSNPEVLVSDLGMPDEDGYDLIREIRGRGHHARDLPAVALSAFAHKNDRRQALLAGFQMHISKPADPHDLTAAIASLAGRTGPAA